MSIDLQGLVQPDRVHKRVYTDPAIFELEMDRVFGQAWLYVGHESQVPNPGDYFTTRLGREPVVMLRHTDGAVHVLFNRCPHKGAAIVPEGSGSAGKFLRCLYHGWTFKCDGSLLSVPLRSGYEDTALDLKDPQYGVRKVARVATHRGFVFASLAKEGPELVEFLGGVATSLDNFCDRAPDGEVEVAGGVQRVIQRNNWKIFFENLHDTIHAVATHESSWRAAKEEHAAMPAGTPKPFEVVIVDGNGEPLDFWEKLELKGYDNGHGFMEGIFVPPTDPVSLAYVAALQASQGAQRAAEILRVNRHNTIVYPSCSPHTSFQQIRVIRPLAVDRTLVEIFSFRLKGAPEATFQRTLKYTNIVNSPSSNVMPDDLEAYNRVQEGLASDGGDWVSMHRGAGRDQPLPGGRASNGNSEMPARNMFAAWAGYMGVPAGGREMNFSDWNEQQDITQFLQHEARLLDEHRWDEWQRLFTPDGLYWVPLTHGQTDHLNHASLFCEDALLRSMRARRLGQARAYSQQPPSRTVHVLGNIGLESREDSGCVVRSTFMLLEWRKTEQRAFGGSVLHTLRREAGGLRIQTKRIDLINCDAPHEALQVFM